MEVSVYLLSAFVAWATAELVKYILSGFKTGRWLRSSPLFHSGNMPSVHTATTVALATSVGLKNGVDSAEFAIALLFMAVVAYDAMGVRRAAGEQGLALKRLLKPGTPRPYHALGHKPLEVAAGAAIGLIIALTVAFITTVT